MGGSEFGLNLNQWSFSFFRARESAPGPAPAGGILSFCWPRKKVSKDRGPAIPASRFGDKP